MGDLTKHFNRAEFRCKCSQCGFDTVDVDTLALLEECREHFQAQLKINSGCRCAAYNTAVGGTKNSQHVYGRAVDIVVKGRSPEEVAAFIETLIPHSGGIGIYSNFVHVDTRTGKARWRG